MALVLVPTRELALQVQKLAAPIFQAVHLNSHAVIGGQGRWKLLQELRQACFHLIVGTPGRVLDVVSSSSQQQQQEKQRHHLGRHFLCRPRRSRQAAANGL